MNFILKRIKEAIDEANMTEEERELYQKTMKEEYDKEKIERIKEKARKVAKEKAKRRFG